MRILSRTSLKTSKKLLIIIIILEVTSFTLFLITGQVVYSVLNSTFSQSGEIPVKIDEKTNIATLIFNLEPRNDGYISSRTVIGISFTTETGESYRNTTMISLQPFTKQIVTLTLKLPAVDLNLYSNGKGSLELSTDINTLNDLIGMNYKVKVHGGQT